MIVVVDSTPLIHLSSASDLVLLKNLFGSVIIPPAVHDEVVAQGKGRPGSREVADALNKWIYLREPELPPNVADLMRTERLHVGEMQAILLASDGGFRLKLADYEAILSACDEGNEH